MQSYIHFEVYIEKRKRLSDEPKALRVLVDTFELFHNIIHSFSNEKKVQMGDL